MRSPSVLHCCVWIGRHGAVLFIMQIFMLVLQDVLSYRKDKHHVVLEDENTGWRFAYG